MQNYDVRVYRTYPTDEQSVSGIIENINSDQKEVFHNLKQVQYLLAHSIAQGLLEFPVLAPQELDTHDNVAVID